MTEAVLASLDEADAPLPSRRAEAARRDRRPRAGPRRARGSEPRDGPRPRPRRDRLPARVLRGPPAEPDRRRAHHVRPGELGALPPQDLQRVLGGGRPAPAAVALPDDPGDGEGEPHRNGQRLLGQRGGHGGPDRPPLPGRARDGPLRLRGGPDPHAHEGGDAQPPDRDLALPRRRDRLRAARSATRARRAAAPSPRRVCAASRSRACASPATSARGKGRSRAPTGSPRPSRS